MQECNRQINRAMEIARRLTILADEGEMSAEDDSCILLYSIIRDCAYKIRQQAEREREAHIRRGVWDGEDVHHEPCRAPGSD